MGRKSKILKLGPKVEQICLDGNKKDYSLRQISEKIKKETGILASHSAVEHYLQQKTPSQEARQLDTEYFEEMPEEADKNMSNGGTIPVTITCDQCGGKIERSFTQSQKRFSFCKQDCRDQWMKNNWNRDLMAQFHPENFVREEHPSYKGGHSKKMGANYHKNKEKVRERDNNTCQVCGTKQKNTTQMHTHHIKPRREFNDMVEANKTSNLITLCCVCHPKVEHGLIECPEPEKQ